MEGLPPWAAEVVKAVAEETHCQAMLKCFRSRRDSQAALRAQQRARGNGLPCHKHQEKPRSPPVVVQLVLVVGHYDYHPHKDSGPGSLQGSRSTGRKYGHC